MLNQEEGAEEAGKPPTKLEEKEQEIEIIHDRIVELQKMIYLKEKVKFKGRVKAECHDEYPMLEAYVIFESKEIRDKILSEYQRCEKLSNFLSKALCKYGKKMFPPAKFMNLDLIITNFRDKYGNKKLRSDYMEEVKDELNQEILKQEKIKEDILEI